MIVPFLSASRINTYLTCPHQYYATYELKKKPETPQTIFGTIMHSVIEKVLQSNLDKIEDHESYFKEVLDQVWQESPPLDYGWYKLAQQLIVKMIDEEEYLKWYENLVSTEEYFEHWLNDEVCVLGYIDLVIEEDEDTLVVIDHKTSMLSKTQNEADEDIQLGIYDLAIREMYPGYENYVLAFNFFRHNIITTERTEEQRQSLTDFLINTFYQICNDTGEKTNINPLCSFCVQKDSCPALQNDTSEFKDVNKMSIEELAKEHERVNTLAKTFYKRKKDIEDVLKEHMEENPGNKMKAGDKDVTVITRKQTVFNPYDIYDDMDIHDFLNCASITKTSLEKLAKEKPEYKPLLKKGESVVSSSYINIK